MSSHVDEALPLEDSSASVIPSNDIHPRVDGGRDAWLFLAACFVVEAILWGLPFSFGIFQDYYYRNAPFAANPSGITVVGTTASGVMYLGSPFVFLVLKRWPTFRKTSNVLGVVITVLALIASSFADKVWHLILSQGILYGVGGAMSYCPCILYLDEWFQEKQGLAFGIMWAGTGLGGLVVPFVVQATIDKWGFRTVLRGFAVAFVVLLGPLVHYLKPRLPTTSNVSLGRNNFTFLRLPRFWIYQIPNIVQGLGYFIPALYMPSYASARAMPSISGPLTVALFNAALVGGTIVLGAQTDRLHVTTVIVISTTGAAVAVLALWGVSISLPALCIFSLIYGFFAGAYSTCWSGIVKNIQKVNATADTGLVFGMFLAGRGIGNLASGPVSESLLGLDAWPGRAGLAYGTEYGSLIVFVGLTAFLSGTSWGARRLRII